jgi:general stress protein CsbA
MTVGLRNHYVMSCLAVPLLAETAKRHPTSSPLIINISSFGGASYVFNVVGERGGEDESIISS